MGEITEADRAAARAWLNRPRGHSDDQADAVQAFAAHRQAALIEGARQERQNIVEWLQVNIGTVHMLPAYSDFLSEYADAIERGEHQP